MKLFKNIFVLSLFLTSALSAAIFKTEQTTYNADYQWTIVGAGPAGIIVIGLLLDLGTDPKDIAWIDPEFNVGRIGKYYGTVPGNSTTSVWIDFLNSFKSFRECLSPALEKLHTLDPNKAYELQIIIEPLSDICNFYRKRLNCKQSFLRSLSFENEVWQVGVDGQQFTSGHVVLATGSHPRQLDYECKNEIPLDLAFDKKILATYVCPEDTIAVIGSAQSAILLLKHLTELSTGRVINFYRHQVNFHNELFGMTAEWAKTVLATNPPAQLIRMRNTPEALKAWLPVCTKIIYAVGYDRNDLPTISNAQINFDDKNGIIGPRLFGIGIAFPEKIQESDGSVFSRIGLISFMEYAQHILPSWIATKIAISRYASYEDLFTIDVL